MEQVGEGTELRVREGVSVPNGVGFQGGALITIGVPPIAPRGWCRSGVILPPVQSVRGSIPGHEALGCRPLLLSKLSAPRADAVVALLVLGFVGRAAWKVIVRAVEPLSDAARLDSEEVSRLCLTVKGVRVVRAVREPRNG